LIATSFLQGSYVIVPLEQTASTTRCQSHTCRWYVCTNTHHVPAAGPRQKQNRTALRLMSR